MKKALLTAVTAILALCSGCMRDNRDDCPEDPYNLILHFVYLDQEQEDVFAEHIDKVDLVIFNDQRNFHSRVPLSREMLEEFQGAKLELSPGTYYIVCWGNVKNYSRLSELGTASKLLDEAYLEHLGSATTDALFYAPEKSTGGEPDYSIYAVEVPRRGVEERTLGFMGAHHIVNVYVSGYEDVNRPGDTKPKIEITDLSSSYDYHLTRSQETIDFRQITGEVIIKDGTEIETASFYTPHFGNRNSIEVRVRRASDDEIEYVVELEEFLRENDYDMIDGARIPVDIYIEFGDVDVKVSVPDWLGTNTGGIIS